MKKKTSEFHEAWGTVYLNGEYIPADEAKLSFNDLGFTKGDAVFDVTRTFNHKPYKLKEHIQRLYKSLKYVRIDPGITEKESEEISLELIKKSLTTLSLLSGKTKALPFKNNSTPVLLPTVNRIVSLPQKVFAVPAGRIKSSSLKSSMVILNHKISFARIESFKGFSMPAGF